MNPAAKAAVARARDQSLIPGIYNYCHRRCSRCEFTGRCLVFREEQERRRQHGDRDLSEELESDLELTIEIMRAWCEREGIEFNCDREIARQKEMLEHDPLLAAATQYAHAAYEVVEPLQKLSALHDWPGDSAAAVDTISWNASFIASKIGRALYGAGDDVREHDEDPVQNDWNGSAKAVRVAIAESLAAWDALFAAGQTPEDASIRKTAASLKQLDCDIANRFPRALEFVRPGFDEPDVAAGALTTLAPFESRRPTLRGRIQRWFGKR